MICNRCGAEAGNARFCPACGSPITTQQQPQQPAPQQQYVAPQQPVMVQKTLGMKWYKWLMVVLIIGAVLEVGNAGRYFSGTGLEYESVVPGFTAADMYSMCEGLQMWDILMGVFCIIVAGMQIIARITLGKYKKTGPLFLYASYAISLVWNLVYAFGAASTFPSESMDFGLYVIYFTPEMVTSTAIGMAVVSAIVLVLNIVYFNKRKHLFVN